MNRPRTGPPAGGQPVAGEDGGGCSGDQDDPATDVRCSIVIPTYRRAGYLRRCLEAVAAQTRTPEEVVLVVHPADTDSLAAIRGLESVRRRCEVRTVFVSGPGIIQAENQGVEAARGDILAFLDDDTVPPAWWLAGLLAHYVDPSVGGVGGPVIPVVAGIPHRKRAWFPNRVVFPGLILDSSTRVGRRVTDVDHLRGANMSLRRHLIQQIGGFDTRLLGDQFRWELDACLAVRRLGYRLRLDPTLWVNHFEAPRVANGVERSAPETVYRNAYNETYVLLKHTRTSLRPLVALASLLVGSLSAPGLMLALASPMLRHCLGSRHALGVRLLGTSLRGKWAGLRTWGRGK